MSADRPGDEPSSAPGDAASSNRFPRSMSPFDAPRLGTGRVPVVDGASDQRRSVTLAARIERTRLELQVAALEDALETSERRRQAVIDRYEHLLEEQPAPDETPTPAGRLDALLARFHEG